jgi:hypothetical protein
LRWADEPRQRIDATAVRHDSDAHEGLRETRRPCSQHDIASKDKVCSRTRGKTIDRCNDRLVSGVHNLDQRVPVGRELRTEIDGVGSDVASLLKVLASGKCSTRPAYYDNPAIRVFDGIPKRRKQFGCERSIHRIQLVRSIKEEPSTWPLTFYENEIVVRYRESRVVDHGVSSISEAPPVPHFAQMLLIRADGAPFSAAFG